ncbi:MAG: hypothetical protein U0353_27580 [Sandaracinus sp.]
MQDPHGPPGQPSPAPLALPPSGFTPAPSGGASDDVLGWVGVGLGGVAWLACCCSIIPFVGLISNILALLMAIAAIVLGGLSFHRARKEGRSPTLGILAMVLGAARLGIIAFAILVVVLALVFGIGGGMAAALQQGLSP